VAYGARLESVLGASPRGFESPILRRFLARKRRFSGAFGRWGSRITLKSPSFAHRTAFVVDGRERFEGKRPHIHGGSNAFSGRPGRGLPVGVDPDCCVVSRQALHNGCLNCFGPWIEREKRTDKNVGGCEFLWIDPEASSRLSASFTAASSLSARVSQSSSSRSAGKML
jgi:hypothetical protein